MNANLKRHRPDIKVLGEGKALAFMPEDPMGVWVHIQEVRDLIAAKDNEIENLKKKLAEYEDCAANACAERDDNQVAIDELNAENAAYEKKVKFLNEQAEARDKMIKGLTAERDTLRKTAHDRKENYLEMQTKADRLESKAENRKLKRALYKACANWARAERYAELTWHGDELWANVQAKCLKKAEECK